MGKTGWDSGQKAAEQHAATGKFCRLENDGEKIVVAFLGEPFSREVVWNETTNRYEDAPEGEKSQLRVSINVYNVPLKRVQIFEGGVTWFRQVLAVREKYGLDVWYFEMTRQGAKGSPKTTYTIFPEKKIEDDAKKDLSGLELYKLDEEVAKGDDETPEKTGNGAQAASGNGSSSDRVIDPDVATRLVTRLKELPKESLKPFLATFGVSRVRDIPFSRQGDAVAEVDALAKSAEKPAEVDPFS